jgi:DnaJ-class molecular chaperone
MATAKDPFEALGVSRSATQDEIRNAYRALAKRYHPDLNPGNKAAEARFKEISTAYDLVGTPEAREKFLRGEAAEAEAAAARGRAGPFYYETQSGTDPRYSTSFEGFDPEFFESLFGGGRRGGARARGRGGPANFPGEDRLYRLEIDFRDAILGAEKEVTLPDGKRLRVRIPPGTESGSRLRLAGQGGPGVGQGPAGDAYVEIEVRPSAEFRRVGRDIELDLSVPLDVAVLGGEVKVPTVEGPVMMRVPPGISSGARLRLRGKGVPARGAGERGDQFARVQIELPKERDPELERAVRDWIEKRKAA